MKKYGITFLVMTAVLVCSFTSSALVTLTADPADGYGSDPAMFTLDPELYNPAGRGVAATRQLRQTFLLDEDIDVTAITFGCTFNGNDGGLIIDFYEVGDVNANPVDLGTLVHTITIGTEVDLPATSARLRVGLTGSDVFSLPQRNTGNTNGYAIEFSNADGSTTLGNLRHSNDGTEHYTTGRFYTESGNASGTGRDAGVSLIAAFVSPFPNLDWAVGNGTWDVSTTANWDDGVAAAVYQETNGLGNNVTFEDTNSAGGSITVTLDATVAPASTTADTTNSYTISGFGAISGPGTLTKTGSGTLALLYTGFSDLSGVVNINEGVLEVSSANLGEFSLSPPVIVFDGGTLRYAAGNTTPFAFGQVVTFAGDATIDTGANFLSFVDPIGSGGPGGLTKTGSGSLTLTGDHTYTGSTVISEGTLDIGISTLSGSAVIDVASGALLEAFGAAQSLSASASQTLQGSGLVKVAITAPVGTSVSPAASGSFGTLTFGNASSFDGSLTLDGGTLEMDISNASKDLIVANNGFSITENGGIVALNVSGTLNNGNYTLVSAPDGIFGALGAVVVTGFSQPGQIAFLDSTSTAVTLVVANAGDADLVWTGSSGNFWDVETTASWSSNAVSTTFVQGDSVTFNATGAGQPVVDLQAAVFPTTVTVDATSDYTLSTTAGGRLGGATDLTKNNTGKLTILTDNNNSGLVTINAGTVEVGDGASTAHIGDGGFVNDGSLIFNPAAADDRTVGSISGSGSVTQNGAAVITVDGDATYTGATTIGAGASLGFGTGGALAAIGTPSISNDGTFIYDSSSDATLPTISGSGGVTKSGAGNVVANTLSSGQVSVDGGTLELGGSILTGPLAVNNSGSTLDMAGFDQTISGLSGTGNGVITNASGSGTNTLTINSATDSTAGVLINDGASVISVVKNGAGVIGMAIPAGASTYSGGTLITGPGGFNVDEDDVLGTGLVTFDGGFITMNDQNDLANPVHVLTEANYEVRGNIQFRGAFSGDSNAVINISSTGGQIGTFDPGATMDDFYGTIAYVGANRVQGRFRGDVGGPQVTFDMGTNNSVFYTRDGQDVALGHLIATSANSLYGATSSDNPTTFIIGGGNLAIDFPGTITDQFPAGGPVVNLNRWTGITKDGNAILTLSGTNVYSGPTTVNAGTLEVSAVGGLDNSRSIIVAAGATLDVTGIGGTLTLGSTTNAQSLGGSGTVTGNVLASGTGPATIAPGMSAGELTISGNLVLAGNSTVAMELDTSAAPTSDRITATAMTGGAATLTVTNIGPLLSVGQSFTLFSPAIAGLSWAGTVSDVYADYTFTDNIAVDGTIEVATVTPKFPLTPTNITWSVSGGNLNLGWPTSYTGWVLQTQTNPLNVGLSTNWVTVPGSGATNAFSIPVSDIDPTVFYRMSLP